MATGLRVGEVLAGKYRIEKVLGVGGMGVVVAAHHLHLDEKVAIKFLLPEVAQNPEAAARFLREARAAIKIKSEHVARVTDVGTLEDGTAFLVMEYLNGRDLASWIRDDGPLAVPQAVEFVVQACEAIAEAHALGIIHRDLKPANLFVIRRADGLLAVRVLDFGISKVSGGTESSGSLGLTKAHQLVGSPRYMSPEQLLASRDIDGRSDIWSLGIVLYELLAGTPPFGGDSMPIICSRILEGPVVPLRDLRVDVPAGLEAAVLRCLEKVPSRRFSDVAELASALADFGPPRARFSVERIARTVDSGPARPPGSRPANQPALPPGPSPATSLWPAPAGGTQRFELPSPGSATLPSGLDTGGTRRARGRVLGWSAVLVGTVSAGLAAWLVGRPSIPPAVRPESGVEATVAPAAREAAGMPIAPSPQDLAPVTKDRTTEGAAAEILVDADRSPPSGSMPEHKHAAPKKTGPRATATQPLQSPADDYHRNRRKLLDLADQRK